MKHLSFWGYMSSAIDLYALRVRSARTYPKLPPRTSGATNHEQRAAETLTCRLARRSAHTRPLESMKKHVRRASASDSPWRVCRNWLTYSVV
jgi:hypothetical protein